MLGYGDVNLAAERTPLPDGTVRWWVANPGWGVIASDNGDVAFRFLDLDEANRQQDVQQLVGCRVQYTVSEATRGVYRAAYSVASLPARDQNQAER